MDRDGEQRTRQDVLPVENPLAEAYSMARSPTWCIQAARSSTTVPGRARSRTFLTSIRRQP